MFHTYPYEMRTDEPERDWWILLYLRKISRDGQYK
jgi:hypothetical protein